MNRESERCTYLIYFDYLLGYKMASEQRKSALTATDVPDYSFVKTKNMCLAIPGKILSIADKEEGIMRTAKVLFGGITKEANLELVPEAKEGDYVLVHVGVALTIIDEDEALKTLRFLEGSGEMDEIYN